MMNKKLEQQSAQSAQPTDNPLVFDIAELAIKPQGSTDEYVLDTQFTLSDPDIKPKTNLKGKVKIMKLDQEFNVEFKDLEVGLELECQKCLEPFTQKIEIQFAEKQYAVTKSPGEDRDEIGYVNTKNHTIDIGEFLRQEIILHFPLIPVCSTHCNGINLQNDG